MRSHQTRGYECKKRASLNQNWLWCVKVGHILFFKSLRKLCLSKVKVCHVLTSVHSVYSCNACCAIEQSGFYLTESPHEETEFSFFFFYSCGGLSLSTAFRHSSQCVFQRSELWKKNPQGLFSFFERDKKKTTLQNGVAALAAVWKCLILFGFISVISHFKNTESTWCFVRSIVGCRLTWKTSHLFFVCVL